MSGQNQGISDEVLEAAADWLFRVQAAPADARLRRELDSWIGADPRHHRAWQAARRGWMATGAAVPAFASVVPMPRRAPRLRPRVVGMALAAGIAAVALLPGLALNFQADYRTATAESRAVDLADGSLLTLAADSAVATDFSGALRTVSLLRGEAHFEIKADRARPFVVTGGDITVTVTGTAFDVSFSDQLASVGVSEGSVVVTHGAAEMSLVAGQGVVVDRASGEIRRRAVDRRDVGAWRHGRLVVGDELLSSVVDNLRRHHNGVIVLADDVLANKRVTGVYDLADPERALRALVGPYGGKVLRITPFVLMVSSG